MENPSATVQRLGAVRRELIENQTQWLILDRNKVARNTGTDLFTPLIDQDSIEFELCFDSPVKPSTRVYRFTPRR